MERRGSGLKRIREAFIDEELVDFCSNQSNFFVVMKKQTADEIENIQDERLNERIMSGLEQLMNGLNEN